MLYSVAVPYEFQEIRSTFYYQPLGPTSLLRDNSFVKLCYSIRKFFSEESVCSGNKDAPEACASCLQINCWPRYLPFLAVQDPADVSEGYAQQI